MNIDKRTFPCQKGEIAVYKLENRHGAWVELSTLGAGVVGLAVPDRNGIIDEVALGYANPADYLYDGPCMGKCPGRYANRIAKGHLDVDGKKFQLAINNGPNALHGGPDGFQNQIWEARVIPDGIEFSYTSKDGEENYPGTLSLKATYTWSEDNVLSLRFEAVTDKKTVVNLTNHSYWNLSGKDSGSVLEHEMKILSDKWLPTDATQIPDGELADVASTPMDFRDFKALGKDINADFEALKIGKGYDHCWALRLWEPGKTIEDAVVLRDNKSGRILSISTDQPGVQIYTGNWLDGSPENCKGHPYKDYDGVAIEMQGYPDAPNKPGFPSQWLNPGETYSRSIVFRFSTEK